jgi:hypothetical protein
MRGQGQLPFVVAILIAVLAVSAALQSYTARSQCARPDAFGFEQARMRVAALRKNLPPNAVFGYLSDLPVKEHAGGMARQALQYALAPALVLDGADPTAVDWVIGNFSRPGDFARFGADRGLRLVGDFGNGVVLYKVERR